MAKKSDAGLVKAWMLLDGENKTANSDLSAKIVVYCLPITVLDKKSKTVLSGLKNGYLKDRPIKHFQGIVVTLKVRFKEPFMPF